MNEIQSAAFLEGYGLIAASYWEAHSLDAPLLSHWLNTCVAGDATIEKKLRLIERDAAGNITKNTTLSASRAELCGYRLAGAFAAVEAFRAYLDKKGVVFDANNPLCTI